MPSAQTAIFTCEYFPCIAWFSDILAQKACSIDVYSNYQKASYRNRCHVLGANGIIPLSIPLKGGRTQRYPLNQVCISYDEPWQAIHWKTLISCYHRTPFFEYYAHKLQPLFEQKPQYLWEFTLKSVQISFDLLQVNKEPTIGNEHICKTEATIDFRNSYKPNKNLHNRTYKSYLQPFAHKHGFVANMSILDLLFCAGPQSISYL